ncbi:MAG: hypothetical protein IJ068_03195 [Bacilli bacterium]|nr:hypothetical protein [Bacilli bacterium]
MKENDQIKLFIFDSYGNKLNIIDNILEIKRLNNEISNKIIILKQYKKLLILNKENIIDKINEIEYQIKLLEIDLKLEKNIYYLTHNNNFLIYKNKYTLINAINNTKAQYLLSEKKKLKEITKLSKKLNSLNEHKEINKNI